MTKTFAETYTMRSRFFHDLGEAAKKLAQMFADNFKTFEGDVDAKVKAAGPRV